MRTAFAVGDAPAGAKSPAFGKGQLWSQDQLFGRAHPARRSTDVGKSSLGALLREREVTGRDASLPAPLLAVSLELVVRGTVGALPQTPQGTLSLDPARGNFPLDPFRAIELVSLPYSFRVLRFGRFAYHYAAGVTSSSAASVTRFSRNCAASTRRGPGRVIALLSPSTTWPSFTAVTSSQPRGSRFPSRRPCR